MVIQFQATLLDSIQSMQMSSLTHLLWVSGLTVKYGLCWQKNIAPVLDQETSSINGPATPEEAVEDILDFYFGDPARMKAKAEARKHPVRLSESDSDKAASA